VNDCTAVSNCCTLAVASNTYWLMLYAPKNASRLLALSLIPPNMSPLLAALRVDAIWLSTARNCP
jgi:hypothetical protein